MKSAMQKHAQLILAIAYEGVILDRPDTEVKSLPETMKRQAKSNVARGWKPNPNPNNLRIFWV